MAWTGNHSTAAVAIITCVGKYVEGKSEHHLMCMRLQCVVRNHIRIRSKSQDSWLGNGLELWAGLLFKDLQGNIWTSTYVCMPGLYFCELFVCLLKMYNWRFAKIAVRLKRKFPSPARPLHCGQFYKKYFFAFSSIDPGDLQHNCRCGGRVS